MYSRTINILTLSSWILVSVIEDVSCNCTEVATKPGCADGWGEIHSPYLCIKLFQDTPKTWEESEDYCNKIDPHHSSLWFTFDPNELKLVEQYLQTKYNGGVMIFWVGLKYGVRGFNTIRKINGNKRCHLFRNGRNSIKDCTQKHNFLCVREHQIYYREMELSIKYHDVERSPHVLYIGRDVEFTCSVFLPRVRSQDVYIYRDKRPQIVRYKEEWELQRTKYGLCSNRSFTTSKLQNYDGAAHKTDSLTIRCGYNSQSSNCGYFPMDCCREKNFTVVFLDPPVDKVNLSVENVTPTTVILTCTVNTFRTGVLTWIQWVGSEASMLDLRLHSQNFSSITLENNRELTTSTIKIKFTKEQGIDVICFDHQVLVLKLDMKCRDTDAAQIYCQRFFVKPKPSEPTNLLLPIIGVLALLVLILLGWAITRHPIDGHHGGVGETVKDGDSQSVTETVTATEEKINIPEGTSLRQSGTSTDIDLAMSLYDHEEFDVPDDARDDEGSHGSDVDIPMPLKNSDGRQKDNFRDDRSRSSGHQSYQSSIVTMSTWYQSIQSYRANKYSLDSDQELKRMKKKPSKTDNRKSYGYTHRYNSY